MSAPDAWVIRDVVYRTFAAEGRAPSVAELARKTGLTPALAQQLLRTLADEHALVLAPDGDSVRMAHPFSAWPMAFVVTPCDGRDDRRWWGGCAWDSFGISAALDLDVRIDTACPACGTPLSLPAGPATPPPAELSVWFPKPADQWWDDVVGTCTMIRMFCDRGHVEDWSTAEKVTGGQTIDATTVWRLSRPWYGDRLRPDFAPHTRDHNQELLQECGLTGDFWRLP
ncbi:organomercurial lyase [Actinoallomurus acaciae]|uniref:Organomercurial lyase n=1 Tax=Actinoallomurus acaciae TaxID=502577 RepID=A0ABV5YJD2_9ACTN